MKYFTKKQQEILRDNKYIVVDNTKAYQQTDVSGIYLNIVNDILNLSKTINKKTEVEYFNSFNEFSQRYLINEENNK